MIGILIIQLLKARGCRQIIAVDVEPERLEMAQRFGATTTLASNVADLGARVRQITEGRGADVTFEAVGLEATVRMALESTRKGGTTTLVGNLSPKIEFPLQAVVTRELTLVGSCASAGEYSECLAMIADGFIDVSTFVSAVAPLSHGAEWFERLRAREKGLMKVLLAP
jgi:L-iditol 2-dehydrogenase